jgi:Flp pilus assembly protein TadD
MFRAAVVFVSSVLLASQTPEALLQHAIAAHQKGDIETAIREYRAFLKIQPATSAVRSNLGAALARKGDFEAAIEEYKHALEGADNVSVRLNLAIAYYKTAQIAAAASQLEAVRRAQPDNQHAALLLADCYLRQGKNGAVIELLAPLEKTAETDLSVSYLLGTALIRDNQVRKGQVIIDRILKQGDSAEAHLLLGTTKMQANDFAGAREDLARAVQLNPRLPDVYSYYGLALMSTGDQAAATEAFRSELKTNPNDYAANLQLGSLLRQEQKFDEARAYFRRALQVRPGDAAVRYQMASIDLTQGNLDAAMKQLESIVKETPHFTEAHVTLATVYYRQKRKADGDRERSIVQKLNTEAQARQPGVNAQ